MRNKILITGGTGKLAAELKKHLEGHYVGSEELDFTKPIQKGEYDLILHMGAYTNVIKAEKEESEKCFLVNTYGTFNLVQTYKDVPFIYVSTEYARNPLNVYSLTKKLGEEIVQTHPAHIVIRLLFKPTPFPFPKAYSDQYILGDYVDVVAKLLAKKVKAWDRKTAPLEYISTGRKTIFELAKRTRPDVQPNSVDEYIKETGVLIPKDYDKMKLPNVTLCCIGSEKYKAQHQKALDYSSKDIEFGEVKNIVVDTNTIDEWNRAVVFDLGDHIHTEFALLIHPDGFVVHPELWNNEWLQYDFIGSPFPMPKDDFSYRDVNGVIQRVGNSVSLRSKKLLDLPKKIGMEWKAFHGFYNEDGYISVNMRHVFEEHGCKFAPLEVAKYFGRESEIAENKDIQKTFVFHKHQGRNKNYPNFEK